MSSVWENIYKSGQSWQTFANTQVNHWPNQLTDEADTQIIWPYLTQMCLVFSAPLTQNRAGKKAWHPPGETSYIWTSQRDLLCGPQTIGWLVKFRGRIFESFFHINMSCIRLQLVWILQSRKKHICIVSDKSSELN